MEYKDMTATEKELLLESLQIVRTQYEKASTGISRKVLQSPEAQSNSYWSHRVDPERLEQMRTVNQRAYLSWTSNEESLLEDLVERGFNWDVIGDILERTTSAVRSHWNWMQQDAESLQSPQAGPVEKSQNYYSTHEERGSYSLNKYGMVNPPPTGGIARDTI